MVYTREQIFSISRMTLREKELASFVLVDGRKAAHVAREIGLHRERVSQCARKARIRLSREFAAFVESLREVK